MKLLISQHFSRNKGNVSLLYTLVEAVREHIPGCEVTVASFEPEATRHLFGYRTCEWPFQTRRLMDARGWRRGLRLITESWSVLAQVLLAVLIRFSLISPKRLKGRYVALREICETDLMVSPGGHLFTTFNPFPGVVAHFFPCLLAAIVGVRYVVIAQTIGPFFGFWKWPCRWLTKFVVNHAVCVSVRDDNSLDTISSCGFRPADLKRFNEIVFLYPQKDVVTAKDKGQETRPCVGITFHHIYYRRWMSREDYIARMVRFVNLLASRYEYSIKFISMEESSGGRGDLSLLREIRSRLDLPDRAEIVDLPMDPRQLLHFFAQMAFVVATKTHSVVYGLRQCIPTLAIAYDRKTDDFMRDFAQMDYAIPLATFNSDDAFRRFERLVVNAVKVRNDLRIHLEEIQAQAQENILLIRSTLARGHQPGQPL